MKKTKLITHVGMDKTANLVEAIQCKFPGVDARLGDIRAIPCEDNSFDVVYAHLYNIRTPFVLVLHTFSTGTSLITTI